MLLLFCALQSTSPNMRLVSRMHRADLFWFFESQVGFHHVIRYVNTEEQIANIFAKSSSNFDQWMI